MLIQMSRCQEIMYQQSQQLPFTFQLFFSIMTLSKKKFLRGIGQYEIVIFFVGLAAIHADDLFTEFVEMSCKLKFQALELNRLILDWRYEISATLWFTARCCAPGQTHLKPVLVNKTFPKMVSSHELLLPDHLPIFICQFSVLSNLRNCTGGVRVSSNNHTKLSRFLLDMNCSSALEVIYSRSDVSSQF